MRTRPWVLLTYTSPKNISEPPLKTSKEFYKINLNLVEFIIIMNEKFDNLFKKMKILILIQRKYFYF